MRGIGLFILFNFFHIKKFREIAQLFRPSSRKSDNCGSTFCRANLDEMIFPSVISETGERVESIATEI